MTERINRTIFCTKRETLKQKNVPKIILTDAVVTEVFISNRVTCAGIPKIKTPHELWIGRKLDVAMFQIFGLPCQYHLRGGLSKEFENRGSFEILTGFAICQKAYKKWDEENQTVVPFWDVIFDENATFFKSDCNDKKV